MTATTADAGWYHADGDAPGTVRRWNGAEWIGFPVPDPAIEKSTAPRFEAIHGQVQLKAFAIGAQLALIGLIGVYGMRLYVTILARSHEAALSNDPFAVVGDARQELDSLIHTQTFLWIGAVFLVFLFGSFWFWRAMRNLRLWYKPVDRSRRLHHFTPLFMMLELQTHSPRRENAGVMNPVLAWGWWALFAGAGAVERALERSSYGSSDTAASLLAMRIGLVGLTMISFVLAIVLVEQVTKHQDSRMAPTSAQREQMLKERAEQLSLQADPYRTNADRGDVLYQVNRR